jgi:hypothetical protein
MMTNQGLKFGVSLICITALTACSALSPRDNRASLLAALDSEADGFVLVEGTTQYKISGTFSDGQKLCRTVEIRKAELYEVESFCKIKGGKWR